MGGRAVLTLNPERFEAVLFDHDTLLAVVAGLVATAGLAEGPSAAPVRVDVNESTPLGRSRLEAVDPEVVVSVESGAIEEPTRPRHLSERLVAEVVGRHLMRAGDRRSGGFADAPDENDLTLAQVSAWDTYALGRLARAGHPVRPAPRLFHFRTRHGFTDVADACFARLWDGSGLDWDGVEEISMRALAARPEPLG